ncbi:hypothetical protein M426DRAFT_326297 [Hypoxylon sp. CI-4A]|nr:hypothetical protein M426DRAFT_326297 [Hypoxylon sp. CI-4A]
MALTMDHDANNHGTADEVELSPTDLVWTAEHNAFTLSQSAIERESIPDLRKALVLARTYFPKFETDYDQFLEEVFGDVINRHSIPLIEYMLEHENVSVVAVKPVLLFQWASKPLIESLLAHGWDINTQDSPAFNGNRLINYLIKARYGKEDLPRWLVEEKGATIDDTESDSSDGDSARRPPLLETCAAFGTVSTFKFIEQKGAHASQRMLHVAVEIAASNGADPDKDTSTDDVHTNAKSRIAEMLRYLVDERQLDVNAMDIDVPHLNVTNTHWGTPLCYAARYQNGVPVVRWLMKRGADPTFKNPYSGLDSIACAREAKCEDVVAALSGQ